MTVIEWRADAPPVGHVAGVAGPHGTLVATGSMSLACLACLTDMRHQ